MDLLGIGGLLDTDNPTPFYSTSEGVVACTGSATDLEFWWPGSILASLFDTSYLSLIYHQISCLKDEAAASWDGMSISTYKALIFLQERLYVLPEELATNGKIMVWLASWWRNWGFMPVVRDGYDDGTSWCWDCIDETHKLIDQHQLRLDSV